MDVIWTLKLLKILTKEIKDLNTWRAMDEKTEDSKHVNISQIDL